MNTIFVAARSYNVFSPVFVASTRKNPGPFELVSSAFCLSLVNYDNDDCVYTSDLGGEVGEELYGRTKNRARG